MTAQRRRVFEGVTPYHWLVVIIASAGWLFDCMDQRLFILGRESALRELLQRDPRARGDQDAHRLRDDVDDSRLGHRRNHLRHDERQDRPRENDGGDAHRLLRLHRAFGHRAPRGSTSRSTGFSRASASAACLARRRRSSPRACRPVSGDGAGVAAGAVGARQHHRIAFESADPARRAEAFLATIAGWRVLFFVGIVPALLVVPIIFVLQGTASRG